VLPNEPRRIAIIQAVGLLLLVGALAGLTYGIVSLMKDTKVR
jgi:hypothetical protein